MGKWKYRKLHLTNGGFTLVDNNDYRMLNQWKWYSNKIRNTRYVMRFYCTKDSDGLIRRGCILLHRVITNAGHGMVVDHINHNGLDNRKENLRICTKRENNMNKTIGNKTGFVGVCYRKTRGKYQSVIQIGKRLKHLGYFMTAELAHEAYIKKATELKTYQYDTM